eukprot:m.64492 g.64492  ORF g.64492 m.64492 type:complete len:398 (-) comp11655_c0_seq1:22-1215(-)
MGGSRRKPTIHVHKSRHINVEIRRDRYKKRRRLLLQLVCDNMLSLEDFKDLRWFVRNPYPIREIVVKHNSFLGFAEAMPQYFFQDLFRLPSMASVREVARHLQLPHEFRTPTGCVCSGVEGLMVVLAELGNFEKQGRLLQNTPFNHPGASWSQAKFSDVFNTVIVWIDRKWGHKLEWCTSNMTPARHHVFRDAIQNKMAELHPSPPALQVSAFVDCTIRLCARPTDHQEAMFNGWKRGHCLKYQAVVTPDGIISSLYGPFIGKDHDRRVLSETQLKEKWEAILPLFSMGGDLGYVLDFPVLVVPFKGVRGNPNGTPREQFNLLFSQIRECVEWPFGLILQWFPFLDLKKNQKLLHRPIGTYYRVGCLLTNIFTCMGMKNQVNSFYKVKPISPQEYLS